MISGKMLWLIAGGGLSLVSYGQDAPRLAPVPSDSLEIVTGHIQVADSPASRNGALQLLARARSSYALRSAGFGYDLKITFTVNSLGQTEYDGAWEMEDLYDPRQGLRWTATAAAGYTITEISSNNVLYGTGTASAIPLRLQEARAALFDPIPSPGNVNRGSIRTTTAIFRGAPVTCVLLSDSRGAVTAASGRRWEETEECIDPESGLLQVHSQVPGRYAAYEYSNAPQLGGKVLPRKVIVTEAGQVVSTISVDSLTGLPATDSSLFIPTAEMKAQGPATAMAAAQKIWRVSGRAPLLSETMARPVCVFGMVTSSGQLVEAHSLQPSDPNSQAAVQDARQINFSLAARPGVRPQQHFVFVIEMLQ
jgi:hypothetical protein